MPDPEPLISAIPQKDVTASYVGAGVAEPSDYPFQSHERTLKWINETKEKLPRATPKMREEAFLADPLTRGTIFPYLKNTLLKGGKVETKDNKLYSEAIDEITDWLEYIQLMQVFRDDYLNFGFLNGHSYRRIDPDKNGDIVRLEYLEPSSIEIFQDAWDSSIIAYLQHASVQKDWSKYGTTEDVDSWFIPFTLSHPEIPLTIDDIYLTHMEAREIGNNPRVLNLFTLYKNKYNISSTLKLRIGAAERIIAMHNSPIRNKHNSYYNDDDCYTNNTHSPIDPVIPNIWLKRLLLVTSPNVIYAALSPFIHAISGKLEKGKDSMGNEGFISTLPRKPALGSTNYDAEIVNYNAWVASVNETGKEVIKSLKNGGVYVSGPDTELKPIESARNVAHQFVKGLIDQLDEEIGQNFGFPMALVKATGTELASSRNITQMFNTVHAGERTEYESVANKLIRKQFEGKTWQGTTKEGDKEVTVTYKFEELKAHFVLDTPDTKDVLQEAQTCKTNAETLSIVKGVGASKEDVQALGDEYGFGLLGLDNYEAPMNLTEGVGGGAQEGITQEDAGKINAILKSCLFEIMQEEGLISTSPTDPSGFKEEKLVKKLKEAYKVGFDTVNIDFEGD